MKKILWCGSSHMAMISKSVVPQNFPDFENIFFRTAEPRLRKWAREGGTYKFDGALVSGNPLSSQETYNLKEFSHIIFVGQYLRLYDYFCGGAPISRSLIKAVFDYYDFPCFVIGGGSSRRDWNEPLELFPSVAPGKCFLIPDPPPVTDSYRQIPCSTKILIWDEVAVRVTSKKLEYFPHLPETLDDDMCAINSYRVLRADDYWHMNDSYWQFVLSSFREFYGV